MFRAIEETSVWKWAALSEEKSIDRVWNMRMEDTEGVVCDAFSSRMQDT